MSDVAATDQRLLAQLRLNLVAGIGPRTQRALLDRFGNAESIFRADSTQLQQTPGIGKKLAEAISEAGQMTLAEKELQLCRARNVRLYQRGTPEYPRMLDEVPDAPQILYCRGTLLPRDDLAIAIVGSRRCTLYGRQQAERFANGLARAGMTIVSGLARGIDGAAHKGALAAGGRTLAVFATGLGTVYPPEHTQLADDVAENGALLTESHLTQAPVAGLFPQRNRIISALSLGVIVVEASRKSGALHTARHAMEQGREVFALPGRIDSLASEGCHDLIRDGATLLRSIDDVLEGLGPLVKPVQRETADEVRSPRELTLNDQERQILNLVTSDPQHIDEIVRAAKTETARVLTTLTVLEMKRMVRRLPGSHSVRVPH